jgi:hypothetical protein
MKQPMHPQEIEALAADLWKASIEEFGSAFKVPSSIAQSISDRSRALYSVHTWDRSRSLSKHLAQLMIPEQLIFEMVRDYGNEEIKVDEEGRIEIEHQRKRKRENLDKKIIEWCLANPYEIITVKQLCDIGGVAHMFARKLIKDRPDLFKASDKKGRYEIRNAQDERARDKQKEGS